MLDDEHEIVNNVSQRNEHEPKMQRKMIKILSTTSIFYRSELLFISLNFRINKTFRINGTENE